MRILLVEDNKALCEATALALRNDPVDDQERNGQLEIQRIGWADPLCSRQCLLCAH